MQDHLPLPPGYYYAQGKFVRYADLTTVERYSTDDLETVCRKIRETNNIPIIMLSARSADLDKILGLGTGADDYVTKPFNPLELTARANHSFAATRS